MKGPGDFDTPTELEDDDMYPEDDAEGDVANALIEAGDVGELVADVRGALTSIRAAQSVGVTGFSTLLAWAERLDRMVEAQVELMSGPSLPPDDYSPTWLGDRDGGDL